MRKTTSDSKTISPFCWRYFSFLLQNILSLPLSLSLSSFSEFLHCFCLPNNRDLRWKRVFVMLPSRSLHHHQQHQLLSLVFIDSRNCALLPLPQHYCLIGSCLAIPKGNLSRLVLFFFKCALILL
mgnify:CR=1 FL=1